MVAQLLHLPRPKNTPGDTGTSIHKCIRVNAISPAPYHPPRPHLSAIHITVVVPQEVRYTNKMRLSIVRGSFDVEVSTGGCAALKIG